MLFCWSKGFWPWSEFDLIYFGIWCTMLYFYFIPINEFSKVIQCNLGFSNGCCTSRLRCCTQQTWVVPPTITLYLFWVTSTITSLLTHFSVKAITYGKSKWASRSGTENFVRRHRAIWSNRNININRPETPIRWPLLVPKTSITELCSVTPVALWICFR